MHPPSVVNLRKKLSSHVLGVKLVKQSKNKKKKKGKGGLEKKENHE